ncbi:MAG: hypothetical protein AAGI44_05645 [Pseudomonadota bacterium]
MPSELLPKLLMAFCLVCSLGVSAGEASRSSQSKGCEKSLHRELSALVGGAPIMLADLQAGLDGTLDPTLAAALGTDNSPREAVADGLVGMSPLEIALAQRIATHRCFRAFERAVKLGESDVSGKNRAVLQLTATYGKLDTTEVEYLESRYRRNYMFHLGLGIELRDGSGKIVFARSFADSQFKTCMWQVKAGVTTECLNPRTNENPIIVDEEWRSVIDDAITELLAESSTGLSEWYQLLRNQTGMMFDRKYSIEREVSGIDARVRTQLAAPYLFVKTPSPGLAMKYLFDSLEEAGYALNRDSKRVLKAQFNMVFRARLEGSVRNEIARLQDVQNSRVVLLTNEQEKAFKDAVIAACAVQTRGHEKEDCLKPVKLLERLCDTSNSEFGKGSNPRGDRCIQASMAFGESYQRVSRNKTDTVREARQMIETVGFIKKAETPAKFTQVVCRAPSSESTGTVIVGKSDNYLRVIDAAQNDDGIYLLSAALDALNKQVECVARDLLRRYQQLETTRT